KSDRDLDFEALTLGLVLRAIEPVKRMRIVILDACRNNPFAAQMQISGRVKRSVSRGLVRVEPSGDTLVAYAAKAGTVADDGSGKHSPYTAALLKHLGTEGLEISLLFRRVRDTVLAVTNRQQEPFVYGSLGGDGIYLVPKDKGVTKKAPAVTKSAKAPSLGDGLRFDQPVPYGAYPVRGKSIEELLGSVPLNSPLEGLATNLWQKPCASCHQWNRERLCEQGKSYISAPKHVLRHPHPFGGAYKMALMRWSKSGCN
ncbi:MAG: caspase family protein, partial [Methyloligellaceae bacterium]